MDANKIMKIFEDTAYVRMGGSAEELKAAQYLQEQCAQLGLNATIEPFEVDMATMQQAEFYADGESITCKGYFCAGSSEVEAPFYYLRSTDAYSLSQCKGKIVMIDGYMGYWMYQDLLENGAVGFVTYDGNANYTDRDIDQRELRSFVHKGNKIPGVNINAKDAIDLVNKGAAQAKIILKQEEYVGQSRNVVLDLPGEIDEYVAFTAHYDSTSLSQGAYDNMSGSVGILGIAEHFAKKPHRYGMRFIWCGSEEQGLLGARAFVEHNPQEVEKIKFCFNFDMCGTVLGANTLFVTGKDELVEYTRQYCKEIGFSAEISKIVHSSDSAAFADKGIPAVGISRRTNTAEIHTVHDTMAPLCPKSMAVTADFAIGFMEKVINSPVLPAELGMPDDLIDVLNKRFRG